VDEYVFVRSVVSKTELTSLQQGSFKAARDSLHLRHMGAETNSDVDPCSSCQANQLEGAP
jgi:hypothetical protein